ncbi:N(4)-(beta-N-acetylglucosaminyl)-L-asparaginase-like [Convolutriloba macropyga]|uniref:N(4)-(beta-N-acetylglucosaminyl)-L-asparaginase- like n=1 Tax=Convolutriloba macropyga TaxID=536237 RepID=UPI003F51D341
MFSFSSNLLCFVTCYFLTLHRFNVYGQIVLNTWAFGNVANEVAWNTLAQTGSVLDAVERGCNVCEEKKEPTDCDGSVGWGSHPDEEGEVTLDALIFDGTKMESGSVGNLKSVKKAVSVARFVMNSTQHSLLVGQSATDFAKQMGLPIESLSSSVSKQDYENWKDNQCQPNYWMNVVPDPKHNCGPYSPDYADNINYRKTDTERVKRKDSDHDTIGIIAMDSKGHLAVGLTTNGADHKIPGRVGDSPLVGAGGFARDGAGAAVQTGDGDVMLRFLPTFKVVEMMRQGVPPLNATKSALLDIYEFYPTFSGAIVAINSRMEYSAACIGVFPIRILCQ